MNAHPTREKYHLKNPLVFCHGLLGFVTMLGKNNSFTLHYWRDLDRFLPQFGVQTNTFFFAQVPRTSSIEARANILAEQIDGFRRSLPASLSHLKFNIIGHSMGGLDARYFITKLGGHSQVDSLTTLSTPHHGSAAADWVTSNIAGSSVLKMVESVGISTDAFYNLTRPQMAKFNEEVPPHPDVSYFCVAAKKELPIYNPFYPFYKVVLAEEGENDGLVSLKSQQYGQLIHTIECDHLQLINWKFQMSPWDATKDVYSPMLKFLSMKGF